MNDRIWMLLGALLYGGGIAVTLLGIFARRSSPPRGVILAIYFWGFVFQSVGLHLRGLAVGSCPIGNPFEVIQFISWSIIVIYIATGAVFRMSLLGGFCAALASLLSLMSFAVPSWDGVRTGGLFGGNPWIEAHASLALFSYGVFGLLTAISVMYLIQDYGLKHKRFTGLYRYLPPLAQMEYVNLRLLLLGSGVLTISLIIGSVYWVEHPETTSASKLIPTVVLWAAYVVVAIGKLINRIRGARLAWISIGLFVGALIALWPVEADRAEISVPMEEDS